MLRSNLLESNAAEQTAMEMDSSRRHGEREIERRKGKGRGRQVERESAVDVDSAATKAELFEMEGEVEDEVEGDEGAEEEDQEDDEVIVSL